MNVRETGADHRAAQMHLLGRSLRLAGRHSEAVEHYRKAIRLQPRAAEHHVGLGLALRAAGRGEEALVAYRRALSLRHDMAEAHHNLGNLLVSLGRTAEAKASYHNTLAINPGFAEAHFELGNIAVAEGDDAAAVEAYAAAAIALPRRADFHLHLARLLQKRGDQEGAIVAFQRGLAFSPDQPEALANLGILLRSAGRHREARGALERAVALQPGFPEAWLALGIVHHDCSDWHEAAACYAKAIELKPDLVFAHVNLGIVHQRNGRIQAGITSTLRALEIDPAQHKACNNLGSLHLGRAEVAKAMEWQRRALAIDPLYHEALGNLCLTSNYADELGPAEVYALHREYGGCALFAAAAPAAHGNARDPERRLRIGFVSPDLRRHSVAYFLEPLLAHLDRNSFEVVAYYNHAAADEVTARLRALCDGWVATVGLDDAAMAERIRADGIDILVDLAGHTDGNRLPVFARRPAPVQATWLGYLTGTGLEAIDYRITDARVDPEGYEAHAVEHPLRLPGCYLCFRPDPAAPDVGSLPAGRNGFVTFGSFNNLAKLGPATVARWARVLDDVPGSRLLLKSRNLADADMRDLLIRRFATHGITGDRLLLNEWQEKADGHLASYGHVDIALDTWPYNGVTTTCEALWMGVPVVSRVGTTHASRQGRTLLAAVGLDHLARDNDEKFVRACVLLASDLAGLASLRAGMRERLRNSTLLDDTRFATDMGAAFRDIWRRWCAMHRSQ
jgi:predicted O-linked N-acetylglucosamine transferase (SPINDLY family)